MGRIDRDGLAYYQAKLAQELSDKDRERLSRIAELLDAEQRAQVAQVLAALFPDTDGNNASAYLRQLRGRINAAAKQLGLPLAMKVSDSRKGGAEQRWAWFEGGNPLAERVTQGSRRETAELASLPMAVEQRGQPLDDRPSVRWFLSYARKNQALKDKLLDLLLERLAASRKYAFQHWQDQDILPGENWRGQIGQALQQCHFGLLLLSHAFITSEFITQQELPHFVGDRPDKKRAVPVLLEAMDFGRTDLKGLGEQQIFRDGEAKSFDRRKHPKDKDWVDQLVRHIEALLDKYGLPTPTAEPPLPIQRTNRPEYAALMRDREEAAALLIHDARGVPAHLHKEREEDLAADASQALDALEHLLAWARDRQAPPLFALLAEYGMGKTITCQRLARRLQELRQHDPAQPLPIYLDLRDLTGLERGAPKLADIVEECIQRGWHEPVTFPQVASLFQQGALVIFDGLDEALVHLSERDGQVFTRELLKLLPAPPTPGATPSAAGKILISCRSHYFRTLRDQKNHFTGQERGPLAAADYRAMLLLPFTEEQVAAYLAKALPGADLQALQDTIRSVHNLTELTQRPYTLKLVARFIPQIETWRAQGRHVNGVTLYRQLVLSWLERDSGKHQLKAEHKARFMAHLAAELWRGKRRLLPASELDNGLHAWLDSQADLRLRYQGMNMDKLEEDLRTATFLVRQDGEQEAGFRFAHSSLQEYFLAEYLLANLREGNRNAWALAVPSRETLDFLGQLLAEADAAALLAQLSQWRTPYLAEASET